MSRRDEWLIGVAAVAIGGALAAGIALGYNAGKSVGRTKEAPAPFDKEALAPFDKEAPAPSESPRTLSSRLAKLKLALGGVADAVRDFHDLPLLAAMALAVGLVIDLIVSPVEAGELIAATSGLKGIPLQSLQYLGDLGWCVLLFIAVCTGAKRFLGALVRIASWLYPVPTSSLWLALALWPVWAATAS